MELGSLGQGRRPTDVQTGLTDQGKAVKLPSRGLPRTGRDEDGNEDSLLQPACTGCRDHLGGGKSPPPKVLTMLHDGPIEGAKR